MESITNLADLSAALLAEYAAIFLWVDWAMQARESEALVQEVVDEASPETPIRFFRIDVSEQSGEVWTELRHWLRRERKDADHLTYSGAGSLILARRGRVISTFVYPASRLPGGLTARELSQAIISMCRPTEPTAD